MTEVAIKFINRGSHRSGTWLQPQPGLTSLIRTFLRFTRQPCLMLSLMACSTLLCDVPCRNFTSNETERTYTAYAFAPATISASPRVSSCGPQSISKHSLQPVCCCSIKTAGREILNQRLCCNHPNIIQFQEVFLTPDHLAIVSEYAPGGDLVDFIERHNSAHDRALMESEARRLFQQIIVGIDFCHQVGSYIPLDLPANA